MLSLSIGLFFKFLQTLAENVPPPYGFRDLLQRANQLRLCQRHERELRYFCKDHEKELCDDCWSQEHLNHDLELLKVNKWKRLSSRWENRRIQVRSVLEFDSTNCFFLFLFCECKLVCRSCEHSVWKMWNAWTKESIVWWNRETDTKKRQICASPSCKTKQEQMNNSRENKLTPVSNLLTLVLIKALNSNKLSWFSLQMTKV